MEQWYVWLAVIIILIIIECMTVGLTTIWFVASGIIALFVSFFTDSYLIQFAIFVILGVLLLVTTRPILVKKIKPKTESTNLDRIIGMEAIVTEEITKHKNGEVKVDGKRWTASANETLKEGDIVTVLEINGVILKVERKGD